MVESPVMIVGNILLPKGVYIEANGTQKIENTDLGISAEIEYAARGWVSNYYTNRVDAVIKDKDGEVRYKLGGYYTSEIHAENVATGEQWLVFKAPKYPDNKGENYGMNALSYQIN